MKKLFFIVFVAFTFTTVNAQFFTCQQALSSIQRSAYQLQQNYQRNLAWIKYNVPPFYQRQYYNSLNLWSQQEANKINRSYYMVQSECSCSSSPRRNPRMENNLPQGVDPDIASAEVEEKDERKKFRINIPEGSSWRQ